MDIANTRVEEVARDDAAAVAVLGRHGIDICCGGNKTVSEAAALHGVDLDQLLAELQAARKQTAGGLR